MTQTAASIAAAEHAARQLRNSVRIANGERNPWTDHGNQRAAAGQPQDQGFGGPLGHIVADLAQSLNVVLRMLERVFPAAVVHVDTHDPSPSPTVGSTCCAVPGFGDSRTSPAADAATGNGPRTAATGEGRRHPSH